MRFFDLNSRKDRCTGIRYGICLFDFMMGEYVFHVKHFMLAKD